MIYGVSSKDYSKFNYYVKRFETREEAEKWLNTEEYDFRTREIYETLEELIEDNDFIKESLDDCCDPGDELTIEDYVEMIEDMIDGQEEWDAIREEQEERWRIDYRI